MFNVPNWYDVFKYFFNFTYFIVYVVIGKEINFVTSIVTNLKF